MGVYIKIIQLHKFFIFVENADCYSNNIFFSDSLKK